MTLGAISAVLSPIRRDRAEARGKIGGSRSGHLDQRSPRGVFCRKEILMPIIEFTDAQYAYIRGFMPVAEAVMNAAVSEADAAQIIVERGFSAALADVIAPAGEAINTQALLQLAMRYPKEISEF